MTLMIGLIADFTTLSRVPHTPLIRCLCPNHAFGMHLVRNSSVERDRHDQGLDTLPTSKMPLNWSGFEIQEIDHCEGCHDQPKAPGQYVAHHWSTLRAPGFDRGLDYLSVFLLGDCISGIERVRQLSQL